jgi:rubrerythrin
MQRDLETALAMAEIARINTAAVRREASRDEATLRLPLSRFRCDGCGCGASDRIAPERCPMCGGSVWTLESPSPSRDGADGPLKRERTA